MKRIVFAAALFQLLGCSWGTVSPDDFKKEFGIEASTGANPEPRALSTVGMHRCARGAR